MFLSAHIAQTSQATALAAFRRCPDPESIQGMRYSNTWLTTSLRSGVLPSLRVTGVMLIAAWDDEQSLDRFVTHPRAKPYADGWRVRLEPARSIGSLPGLPDLPRQEKPTGDRPVAAFTAGRMRANRVLPFIKAAGAAEREASTHPGFLGGITLMRPPMGIGTFTLWRNVREMRQYSLGTHPGGHSKAIGKDRAHPFHHDMLFSRFIPYAAEGEWNGRNPLDMLDSLPRA